ncbi:MAG: VTT domain-containing protein [SAR324 cluster bacterium]|nr:VTT domain-containing protein [SAR324 cluster bacterium]
MEVLVSIINFIANLDQYLYLLATDYDFLIYGVVFLIIFSETGLVVAPFLPGDSLLFLLGTLAGAQLINIYYVMALIVCAALMGDTTNFLVGSFFRNRLKPDSRWISQKHIKRTEKFFDKHGGKSLILARFVPIVRTYAPFVGGVVRMPYSRFIFFNSIGSLCWVLTLVPAGYFLGRFEIIANHISLLVLGLIAVSLIPIGYGIISQKVTERKNNKAI